MQTNTRFILTSILSAVICLAFFTSVYADECTTGVASGLATPDGRPLLWKSRDVSNANQEFHYVDLGGNFIPFIANTYSGNTNEYFGGVNAAGFAIENSNSYNLPPGPDSNGWGAGADDGEIMKRALALCVTVDDFQDLLDSTNIDGRTGNANYGVIDAFGGAAMFETGGYTYTRFNAADSAAGYIVRSNYSYSGPLDNRMTYGGYRHDRADFLWNNAVQDDSLTPQYIFRYVARDLSSAVLDPYPLPFDGSYGGYPYGCVPNSAAICRSTTRSVIVVQGVPANEDPGDAILWSMCGSPLAAVTLPLWVRAGSVPLEFDSNVGSRLSDRSTALCNWIYNQSGVVDTWHLTNPRNNGFWDDIFPVEDDVFSDVAVFVNSVDYQNNAAVAAFQNQHATIVADYLDAWQQNTAPICSEVPGDFATIQEAINASLDGDTVLVHPGTYVGPLEFTGRNIVVGSLFLSTGDDSYIESTVIDCQGNGRSVAVFTNGENANTVLSGFTLQNANTNYGGGVYCSVSSPTLDHLLIKNCQTTSNGAGIYATHSSNPVISHVTVVGNTAAGVGGAIHTYDQSTPTITNSIFWNNVPAAITGTVSISYSDVEGGGGGTNINADPLFVNSVNGDYHLSWTNYPVSDNTRSPCIDSGAPSLPYDPDGTRTDMGAFYFDQYDVNHAPEWTSVPSPIDVIEGGLIQFTVAGTDVDEDALTISYQGNLPQEAQFTDNGDGSASLLWQSVEGDAGDYTATFTLSDGIVEVPVEVSISVTSLHTTGYAVAEQTLQGTIQGSYANTTASDNTYETLTERTSSGRPNTRYSLLEHVWTFQPTGYNLVLHVEAYHSVNNEGDNFILAGSFDGQHYTDLLVVTKTADDNAEQTAAIAGAAVGTYYLRVTDADHTVGRQALDSFFIDNLFLTFTQGEAPNQPPLWVNAPESVVAYAGALVEFTVTGSDPDGDQLTVTLDPDGIPAGFSFTDNGNGSALFSWQTAEGDTGNYTASFTLSDGELEDIVAVPIQIQPTPEPVIILVDDITLNLRVNKRNVSTEGVVTIMTEAGSPVVGALVSAAWSGLYNGAVQGTTNDAGQVTFTTPNLRNPTGDYILTVTDVAAEGCRYDPDQNVETSDQIHVVNGQLAGSGGSALSFTEPMPVELTLKPSFPNPFNSTTTICVGVPEDGELEVTAFDVSGRKAATIMSGVVSAGWHSAEWTPQGLTNGVYIIHAASSGSTRISRLVLLK